MVSSSAENGLLSPRRGETPKPLTIAIDGAAASGKTTVGRLLARKLGLQFLDTGIMYRALAWEAIRQGIPLSDAPLLGQLATHHAFASVIQTFASVTQEEEAPSDDRAMYEELYTPEVDAAASQVAIWPEVREALVKQQQAMVAQGSMVIAGRDIGTVVAPNADLKVFLTASSETRARRRGLQEGNTNPQSQVRADIEARDKRDTERSHSPLIPADDARQLDTEGIDPQQVVEKILSWLDDR